MDTDNDLVRFTEAYAGLRSMRTAEVREGAAQVPEHVIQCLWYDQLFPEAGLRSEEGHDLTVVSPGWWNHGEGPDFKGAQIEFNGQLHAGDVEIHLDPAGWKAHGHHIDARYDNVILHVVLQGAGAAAVTSEGRRLPTLVLEGLVQKDLQSLADVLLTDEYPYDVGQAKGQCADLLEQCGAEGVSKFLHLSGEWRMLNKARALRERMDRSGPDQAVYEAFMYACGFGRFKHHFKAVARSLPYERARQLGQQDPMLLETAFLQLADLLPKSLPEGTTAVPHYGRLRALRRDQLDGLRSLPLTWKRGGVRPTNNPERRLAGAARFLARTASVGLVETVDAVWRDDGKPIARRKAFEALFPRAMGFWASHCTWTGKKMSRPTAPIGGGRIRSIIGNVFIPAGLAIARLERDRAKEEAIFAFFTALPREPDNQITKMMLPRVFGEAQGLKLDFRMQQGLLQMYQDWCEPNPSCRNCLAMNFLRMSNAGDAKETA